MSLSIKEYIPPLEKPRKELKCTRVTRDQRATTINLCQSCLASRKSKSYKLKEADLIQQRQFAFVKESSTSYNCIDQNSRFMEIGYGQTGKDYMCFRFLAFDEIAHATLLDKMQAYGVRATAVEWMRTFFLI